MCAESCETEQELEFDQQLEEDTSPISSDRKIFTDKGDPEVDSLHGKWKRGKLILQPKFQRLFVWDDTKSSRLIESALLDIPLPIIYLSEDEENKEYVIDGQQRLTSFFSFIDGKFPDGKDFKLTGLKVFNNLNEKMFKEIEESLQDKIKYCKIRTITFKKESDPQLKFEIFERLNTGSIPLNEQELRNCIYRGKYNLLLKELSQDKDFMHLLGLKCEEKRMKDVELVLRFASFYHATYLNYNPPIKKFLNDDMEKYKDISDKDEAELRKAFKNTVTIIRSLLDTHAFKRFYRGTDKNPNGRWEEKKFNASLYDILMYTFAKADKNTVYQNLDPLREALIDLMTSDEEFIVSIEKSTSSIQAVTKRFDKWRHTVEGIIGIEQKETRCFSKQLKTELFKKNPTCAICGQEIREIDDSAVDHVTQYWQGGKTIEENARLTHRYCNWSRPRNDTPTPSKTPETVPVAQNSVKQKDNSESLKLPICWEKKLEDSNDNVKLLVKDLMLSITNEFSDLTTKPTGDDFQLCRGPTGLRNRFAVLMLRKDGITIRLRANPRTLVDPQKWITEKTYKWYFNDGNGEEKEIKITQEEQINYAMELIKQSYALVK